MATLGIVIVNVVVFIMELHLGDTFVRRPLLSGRNGCGSAVLRNWPTGFGLSRRGCRQDGTQRCTIHRLVLQQCVRERFKITGPLHQCGVHALLRTHEELAHFGINHLGGLLAVLAARNSGLR